jgi:hypothetical protein
MASINFSLPALDATFQMTTTGSLDAAYVPVSSTDATAVFYVKLSDMAAVFKFQTDSSDMNDVAASDVKYYVFRKDWPTALKLNPAHAMLDKNESINSLVSKTAYDSNKSFVKHDFVRYLAYKLFNTVHGVDLFNNETDLRENLAYYGEVTRCGIEAVMDTVSTTSASVSMSVDAAGYKYLTNSDSTNTNICRELMRQIAAAAPTRFAGITGSTAIQSVPFVDNDSLNIKLTVSAATGQNNLTGVAVIPNRSYNIKLVLKTDITGLNTSVADSAMFPNAYPYSPNVSSIPANTPAVYADASPAQVIPSARLGYNGWYYTNSDAWVNVAPTVRNKINWYLGPNTPTATVGDLRYIRMNLRIFNRVSTPFVTVYTKTTGSGDTGGWYKSKRTYIIWDSNTLTNNTNYSFYINFNSYTTSPAVIGHTNAALTLTDVVSATVGTYAESEVLFAISIGSDSISSRGNVEFTLSSVVVGDASGEKEYGYINA